MEVKYPKSVILGKTKLNLELNTTLHSAASDNGYAQQLVTITNLTAGHLCSYGQHTQAHQITTLAVFCISNY